ncbi:hypothetical protein EVA_08303 [gut metagenome]|uniref:Uncharacterized protein n=1 Tax=gut metagenome TaxID=749906 RepID=J9GTF4_9ZZZZ
MTILKAKVSLGIGQAHFLHLVHALVGNTIVNTLAQSDEEIQLRLLSDDLLCQGIGLFQQACSMLSIVGHCIDLVLFAAHIHCHDGSQINHAGKATSHDHAVLRRLGRQDEGVVVLFRVLVAGNCQALHAREGVCLVDCHANFGGVALAGDGQNQNLLALQEDLREVIQLRAAYCLGGSFVVGSPQMSRSLCQIQAGTAAGKNQFVILFAENLIQGSKNLGQGVVDCLEGSVLAINFLISELAVFLCHFNDLLFIKFDS